VPQRITLRRAPPPYLIDGTRISEKALEIKFKTKRPLGRTRVRCLLQVLEDYKNREKNKKEITINDKEARRKKEEEEKEDVSAVLCLL
jgi:hypothetical protein